MGTRRVLSPKEVADELAKLEALEAADSVVVDTISNAVANDSCELVPVDFGRYLQAVSVKPLILGGCSKDVLEKYFVVVFVEMYERGAFVKVFNSMGKTHCMNPGPKEIGYFSGDFKYFIKAASRLRHDFLEAVVRFGCKFNFGEIRNDANPIGVGTFPDETTLPQDII